MSLSKTVFHVYSEEEKRVFRIVSIIDKEGRQLLHDVLLKQLSGSTIALHLDEPNVKAKVECALQRKVILQDQYNILYPVSGDLNIERIDVTLFAFLIRELHPFMSTRNKTWTNPLPSDLSTEADVTRLKLKRNQIVHRGSKSLTSDDFEIEFQELEMVLGRLASSVNSRELPVTKLVQILADKKDGLFDNKPESLNVATSTSSSLEKVSSDSCSSSGSIYTLASIGNMYNEGSTIDTNSICKQEVATSTSSLDKKRKLSFKVKAAIEPFLVPPKKENEKENTQLPKRKKPNKRQKVSIRIRGPSSFSFRRSCSNSEACSITTNDHSTQDYRCKLSGICVLTSGKIIVTDTSHDIVQALSTSGDVINEFECPKPNGVAAIDSSRVAVSLQQASEVMILKINEMSGCLQFENRYQVGCECWVADVKYNAGYLYILSEKGEIYIINSKTGSNAGSFSSGIAYISHFDINERGDRFFLCHGHQVTCIDNFGNKIWCYSEKTKKAFKCIVVRKEYVYICVWEKNVVLALTRKDGKYVKEYCDEQLRNPWSLCLYKRKLYVSQYMSTLNSLCCREIVVMRV